MAACLLLFLGADLRGALGLGQTSRDSLVLSCFFLMVMLAWAMVPGKIAAKAGRRIKSFNREPPRNAARACGDSGSGPVGAGCPCARAGP